MLRRVPEDLESVTARPVGRFAVITVLALAAVKCALALALLAMMPAEHVGAYMVNSLLFIALTVVLPAPARATVWIPVAAFYVCVFLGDDGESVARAAVLAAPEASAGGVGIAAAALALCTAAVPLSWRARGSRPVDAS